MKFGAFTSGIIDFDGAVAATEEERTEDPFSDEKMDDPVMQKCWLVLGELYYHSASSDFLAPISVETVGLDLFEQYGA